MIENFTTRLDRAFGNVCHYAAEAECEVLLWGIHRHDRRSEGFRLDEWSRTSPAALGKVEAMVIAMETAVIAMETAALAVERAFLAAEKVEEAARDWVHPP